MKKAALILIAVLILVLAWVYFHHPKPKVAAVSTTAPAGPVYTTKVSGLSLTLYQSGTPIQTLTLGEDATADMNLLDGSTVGIAPFITGQDVNFDGYPDVAMLTGIGYGGVNAFYDYYVFDPSTEQLVVSPVLTQICNPVFDPVAKTITGDAKDAQDSYKTVYTFSAGAYVKGPTVSDTTGQVQTDD